MSQQPIFNAAFGGTSYNDVLDQITCRFKKLSSKKGVRMVALIFGQRNSETVEKFILPRLNYWHYRSEDYIDFFCIGFYPGEFYPVGTDGFDARAFNYTVREFEEKSKWLYKGETSILLLNARFNPEKQKAELDFSTVIEFGLERAIEKKVFESIPLFFERVINYAKQYYDSDDPISDWSDSTGASLALCNLLLYVLSLFPGKMGEAIEKLFFVYTKDLSKQ